MSESVNAPVWIEGPVVCQHLRSKQYYMDLPFHSSGIDSGVEVPCWCFKTMKPFGPDSDIASASACVPERKCFEKV